MCLRNWDMASNYKKLGKYIQQVKDRNKDFVPAFVSLLDLPEASWTGMDPLSDKDLEKFNKYDTEEIENFLNNCKDLGVAEFLEFDPSLARGLDYYTGIIYEVVSKDCDFGTICAGGRYDNLCGLFCDEDFSGVGVAFGFERIMLLLEELGAFEDIQLNSKVLVTQFDEESKEDSLNIFSSLIEAGINSEIYFEPDKLGKQLKYADKKRIPFVVIRGSEEREKDEVTIKFMSSGKQKSIPVKQLTTYLSNYYESAR